jgi:hypothetical protein
LDNDIIFSALEMLSDQEIENIQRTLANNPSKNTEKKLKNKLTEHRFASKYPPFTPLQHHRYFFNRKTDEQILNQIIDVAKGSTIILLDTESVPVFRQPNRPGLIQLQLIPNDATPTVIIVEVHHLPSTDSNEFQLMKTFFRIVLDSEKIVYTWGKIDELEPFVEFNLFNTEQIYSPENENLQNIFKIYWQQSHKHESSNDCKCEECIGKKPNQTWKLLDAVAYQLNEWLDKRHTCSPFDIGLDPQLGQSHPNQFEYRNILTNYAANDVLSMEKLMIDMQEHPPPPELTQTSIEHVENISRIIHQDSSDSTEEITTILSTYPSVLSVNRINQSIFDHETNQQKQIDRHRPERTDRHPH